jgi:hypothetical protein
MLKANLVEKDILVQKIEALRLVIGDEMYLMALGGQSFSQFRGYYAGAAESWVAHNSNPHTGGV